MSSVTSRLILLLTDVVGKDPPVVDRMTGVAVPARCTSFERRNMGKSRSILFRLTWNVGTEPKIR